MSEPHDPTINPDPTSDIADEVRQVHRRYPTGVTVVTVLGSDGRPYGLAVNAFSSVSLDPPLINVAINATSSSFPWLFGSDHLAINVLSVDQLAVVQRFARSGGDKFAELDWHRGATGSPLLTGSTGYFELEVRYKIPAYTHTIFIGEVVAAGHTDRPALVYLDGGFYDGQEMRPLR